MNGGMYVGSMVDYDVFGQVIECYCVVVFGDVFLWG